MKEATVLLGKEPPGLGALLAPPLRRKGYRVLVAPDGESMLGILEKGSIAVVLASAKLPDMAFTDLCRKIARRSSDTRLIVLSCDPQTEAARRALMAGVYDFPPWRLTDEVALLDLVDRAAAGPELRLHRALFESHQTNLDSPERGYPPPWQQTSPLTS